MERALRRAATAMVLALLTLGSTAGESHAAKLTKIKDVKFTVAGVVEGAQACGLTEERLQSSFLDPLKGSGVKVVEVSDYFFYIRVTTLRFVTEYCLTYVSAELLLGHGVVGYRGRRGRPPEAVQSERRVHLGSVVKLLRRPEHPRGQGGRQIP